MKAACKSAHKVVLAYSGGLDTSVAIRWIKERYSAEVIAVAVDVGAKKDLDFIREKALKIGASRSYVIDARREFLEDYAFRSLKANGLYEGKYPLSAALSRPLIAKTLVDIARAEGADAVAHGCTGKGNDQVRFDVSIAALAPDLRVIAPVREWPMSREDEIAYARQHDIPVPVTSASPYSIDENLWGRSIECGVLEDPWQEPPEDAFGWTSAPDHCPDSPTYVEVGFEAGVPVTLDGVRVDPVEMVTRLNMLCGANGVGRIDQIENRLVGIKSREVYEAPAAVALIAAHRDLESLTLPRETYHMKQSIDQKYAELAYFGLWFSPLREALDAFIDKTQETVTGVVRLRLFKGSVVVVGRTSPYSLYDHSLATYDKDDVFNHSASEGFIEIFGLPTVVAARARSRAIGAAAMPPAVAPAMAPTATSTGARATAAGT
ncbi:MAG: argininosuccinate synthase [Bacillota bacterium]|nr:argininosuccinate synthase [Bacillota bacterium]MDI6638393.1 argininosuccinate synthase [Bacillota bacterium]